jgi:hypothetical protein
MKERPDDAVPSCQPRYCWDIAFDVVCGPYLRSAAHLLSATVLSLSRVPYRCNFQYTAHTISSSMANRVTSRERQHEDGARRYQEPTTRMANSLCTALKEHRALRDDRQQALRQCRFRLAYG